MSSKQIMLGLTVLSLVVGALMLCGTEFTTLFNATVANKILAALGIENVVLNAINGAIHYRDLYLTPSTPAGGAK